MAFEALRGLFLWKPFSSPAINPTRWATIILIFFKYLRYFSTEI